MLKIGRLSYLNALPLFAAFDHQILPQEHIELVSGSYPAELNELLLNGGVDCALISASEFLRHQQHYTLVPSFTIAAFFQVKSVFLYVRKGLSSLDGCRLALTPESATSVALLQILCKYFWKVSPSFEILSQNLPKDHYDAFLLIGDKALASPSLTGFDTFDLARCWYDFTGLGFPFAVFAVRKEVIAEKAEAIAAFQEQQEQAYLWSLKNIDLVAEFGAERSGLPQVIIKDYFQTIRYRLTEHELAGLNCFADYLGCPRPEKEQFFKMDAQMEALLDVQ